MPASLRPFHAHTFSLLLIAAALLARALVPGGWMPVSGTDGIRIALCTGHGPVAMVMAADGTVHPDDDRGGPSDRRDPCPFGIAAAKAFALPQQAALALPPERLDALLAPAFIAARLVAWRATRPPARGPPAFA